MIKTILLADDSITMQKVIRLTFASGGYEITTADNGDEAIRKAEETRPNIVLVDAALPGRDGYEVCEAIKNNPSLKNTPVMILAGTFNPLDENLAKKAGADDSIIKPFESKHLVEKVEHLFRMYPPSEKEAEPGYSTAATGANLSGWAEDDIIRAPEPQDLSADRGEGEQGAVVHGDSEFEDISVGTEEETVSTGTAHKEDEESLPLMETPHGESEGEDGFDIEGFEINPFKSGPLREEPALEKKEEGATEEWGIDEEDVIGFGDLEPEDELRQEEDLIDREEGQEEVETAGAEEEGQEEKLEGTEGEGAGPVEEEPSLSEEETCEEEEALSAEEIEEGPSGEEGTLRGETAEEEEEASESREEPLAQEGPCASEEEPCEAEGLEEEEPLTSEEDTGAAPVPEETEAATEEAIRQMVRKATIEVIEEVVRDVVPGLMKKAMEDEIERIKEAIRKA